MSGFDASAQQESSGSGNHPSMLGGHARYIQGTLASALGSAGGESTKESAVQEMRRASNVNSGSNEPGQSPSQQPVKSDVLGTIEKKLGELTGCEGMEKDGEARMTTSA